ncbi:hypothetical protein [Cellulomonas chengniuliangii]|uniref:Transporter n=1 Tax=Cellulomonas chengniuliangii TaxID=2968084 RepID=A0ABY5L0K8_9CELL|nr:hypothetical protein [Cellulomonas chengniuliangii]MCC2309199.1 hypothetical protein [Cellulomonas chengniuliangii]MCC2318543.1 hypothetical protein [Cellulomonas chengniuliangii]UUI75221.1 hypothetical protein NP064_15885 [Cellulomonas chengniuliangii]
MQQHAHDIEDAPPAPADGLAIIASQQERVRAGATPDGRLLFLVWGAAWLIGYGALWLAVKDLDVYRPPSGAFIVFGLCISSAVVFTIVHSVRRAAGMHGPSVTAGAMYGWAWGLGFLLQGALIGAFVNAGASHELVALASNGLACLIVGLLYMAGGAMDQEPALFWLGVWILVVAAVASSVGLPLTFLVMALAGGGGFLVGAGIEHARRQARRGRMAGSAARTA